MILRKVRASDIKKMVEIEIANFKEPWNYKTLYYESQLSPNTRFLGLYIDNQIISYVGFWIMLDYIDIINIAVDNNYQRQGLATRLLAEVEDFANTMAITKISLEVNVNNLAAYNLYNKLGYRKVRTIKNYYDRLKEDAYLMQKELKE